MIVIGDIHGCFKSLKKLLSIIPEEKEIYSVGDLVDRGPNSKSVVALCIDRGIKPVMGNHEHIFLDYLDGSPKYGHGVFMANGGRSTLESYGNSFPNKHLEFLASLPLYIETEHFILSHAGVHPSLTLEEACNIKKRNNSNILWNRGELADLGKLQVVGHSPVEKPFRHKCNDKIYGINIDTGCVYPSWGRLSAISFPERLLFQVNCEE